MGLLEDYIAESTVILGVNPEPWAIGTAFASRKEGQMRGGVSPNQKLVTYKKAFQAEWKQVEHPAMYAEDARVSLTFYFWRQVDTWTTGKRQHSGNYADATNLQKSTEDALQGLLVPNDRQVVEITSTIMEQGPDVEPAILVQHRLFWMESLHRKTLNQVVQNYRDALKRTFSNEW